MKVTTITYQRVLNLGEYNSVRLEKTAVLPDEYEDHEVATQALIESVERQIHEKEIHEQLDKEIRDRKKELASIKAEYKALQKELEILKIPRADYRHTGVKQEIKHLLYIRLSTPILMLRRNKNLLLTLLII